jgi:bifunctional UDP-N-acetylglucosamine pyrophosphorylase/glucosamine-1-phosphate N-acetyltransferase
MRRKAQTSLACVVLAAGLGTRMKSSLPKVLHHILGRPMVRYALEAAQGLSPVKTVLVVGQRQSGIQGVIGEESGIAYALQKEQKGTAHALLSAIPALKGVGKVTVLVTCGDAPLLTTATLRRFLALHRKHRNAISVLSFIAENPASYGRIVRDGKGRSLGIIEEKDTTASERQITEVNSGVYAIEMNALSLVRDIKLNKKKGEYYLTDVFALARERTLPVGVYPLGEQHEFMGVNSRQDLLQAIEVMRRRIIDQWLEKGVTFLDASSVFVGPSVRIGVDTVVYPGVHLEGTTNIGPRCLLYPNVRIVDSSVRKGAVIKDSTLVEHSSIGADAEVGPFAHIRPGSRIDRSAKIGNFVEVKKSHVGRETKAMHLSYLGDATIGRNVNIGAGTITCNYDGSSKHQTTIDEGVFVGSDTQLVAPVRVGKGSYIGAGSTITKDVPPGSLALSRAKQVTLRRKKKK